MYVFNYKYIKRKYNAKFLFTDTVSLVYEIKKDAVYENFIFSLLVIIHEIQSFLILAIKKGFGKMKD